MASDAYRLAMTDVFSCVVIALCTLCTVTVVRGETLEVTTIVEKPFYYSTGDKLDDPYTGFCYDLAQELTRELDMELSIKLVPDERYGTYDEGSQTWTGMMGEVVSGRAQVAIAPLTVTPRRAKDVLFTEPFMSSYQAFIAKKPEEQTTPDLVIRMLSVFKLEVWILLFISLILIGIGLWVVAFLIGDEEFCRVEVVINYMVTSLFFLSPLTQPKHTVVRAYTYLWLLFRITVFLVYVVYFVNFSTVERMKPGMLKDFDDVAESAERGEVKVLMLKHGSTQANFEASEQDTAKKIYNSFLNNKNTASTTSENLKLVREGDENYVFIGEMPMLKYVANQPPCSLYVGQDPNSLQPQRGYAIAVNKDNKELHDKIGKILEEFRLDGYFAKLEQKYFGGGTCGLSDPRNRPGTFALSVVAARSLFLLVLVLVLYAIAVFIYSKVSGRAEAVRGSESKKATETEGKATTGGDEENNLGANEHEA